MPTVSVIARNLHRGHIEQTGFQTHRTSPGDIRPVCDTCGWRGPRYAPADEPIAQVGLDAHIATADSAGDNWMYQICVLGTAHSVTSVWDWETLEWQ